ncbi:adenylate/guanylate cyclase domain-containing protein [Phaeobacter sp. HF9A]|uniref:adenylate/guanylate cyclase domain-containing protein n=1 Tax=Phaeobacter sp. HF9A TaxID=2721561 RepID=UPI001430FAEA|nr:adenylate/guanylate cyclase domain-containing protein [Phaeobacter sp. HF9A]NIZ15131.1 adenylate/guanylate cyclase domain-containing protein [Phaeobacter sp. HF9A]
MNARINRKLTTILAADAEQFSTAMTVDEVGTFTNLQAARDVFFRLIDRHGGRVANTAGDGLIADFPSVVEAVQCAIEVQQELAARDGGLGFRIGLHLGDVICDGDDLIGDGVNLAARLQTMAKPGGVLISQQVYDQVRNKLSIGFEYLGEQRPRNLTEDVAVYRVSTGSAARLGPQVHRREAPRTSKSAQVWSDPDPFADAPTRRFAAPDTDDDTRLRGLDRLFGRRLSYDKTTRRLGIVAAGLFLIDILGGSGIWAHWPILALLTMIALRDPETVFGRSELLSLPMRTWTIGGFLLMVNLFTWHGYPWSLWPISAMVILALIRRWTSQPE